MQVSPNSTSLFNYFNAYKVLLSFLLFLLAISEHSYLKQFRSLDHFQTVSLAYLVFNIACWFLYRYVLSVKPTQLFALLNIDIICLHGIFFYGTGIASGLGNLIVITVAAGNIIIRGRIGLSFAAVAAILSLLLEIERFLSGLSQEKDIAQSGLIGILYFAGAYILQHLSVRLSENEILLQKQKQDLLELEKLNHQIIQSMRTGIIVCSKTKKIKLINEACKDLLSLHQPEQLPDELALRFDLWKQQPLKRTSPFRMTNQLPIVQANFSQLQVNNSDSDVLIYIEDTSKLTQQAQQLKLASLGRLTASIAHEVRNPLGAISHATQLLAESENLDYADIKMTDIIQRHSQRVNQIIENTLQLSRRSEPAFETILIHPWIEKILHDFKVSKTNEKRSIRIHLINKRLDMTARFDASQMEQVLINLVENAFHHGEKVFPDAHVFVMIGETKDQNQVYIDILDQGKGIAGETIDHLFEPFFTTEPQGTGLGLYLSKEICEANQAQLDYLDPNAIYADWQTPPNIQDEDLCAFAQERAFGACFRILFAHPKRLI